MLSFISLIRDMKYGGYLVWYMLAAAWLTDTCAYFVGSAIGKHKFSEISPKKSVEGAIAGIFGAIGFALVFILIINLIFNLTISYWQILIISIILAIIGIKTSSSFNLGTIFLLSTSIAIFA